VAASGFTKKELLIFKREKDKLEKTLGGIRNMARVPSAVWIVDTKKEHLAVFEARTLGLPVIAILDTNCDPDEVDYKIPGNDDAIRSVTLLTRVIADAVAEGLMARSSGKSGEQAEGVVAGDEPMAEWERELLGGDAAQAAEAAAPEAGETAAADATDAADATAAATDAPVEAAATAEATEAPAAEETAAPEAAAVTEETAAPEAPAAEETAAPEAAAEVVAEAPADAKA
jgi:small subunit ribosomal protein S2